MRRRAPARANEDRAYAALRQELLGGACEVCPPLFAAADRLAAQGVLLAPLQLTCGGRATEIHHRRKRSSSGAIAHRDNCVPSCHDGNMAVEAHPTVAREAAMVLREGDPEWEALSVRAWRKAQL